MKNNKRGVTQLVANMTHFGTQLTVGALREGVVVDKCVIYGLSINYNRCIHSLVNQTLFLRRALDYCGHPLDWIVTELG